MTRSDADAFARAWIEAWNAHDLDAVLARFADDVVFSSPHAEQLLPSSRGVLEGKAAVRRYWEEGLKRVPDLHFTLLGVYLGVDTIVIGYRNQRGGLANEVLTFRGAQVVEGHGTYLEREPYHQPAAAA